MHIKRQITNYTSRRNRQNDSNGALSLIITITVLYNRHCLIVVIIQPIVFAACSSLLSMSESIIVWVKRIYSKIHYITYTAII